MSASGGGAAAQPQDWWLAYGKGFRVVTAELLTVRAPQRAPTTVAQLKTALETLHVRLHFLSQSARKTCAEYDAQHVRNVFTQPSPGSTGGYKEPPMGPWEHTVTFTGDHAFRAQLYQAKADAESAEAFALELWTGCTPAQRKQYLTWLLATYALGDAHTVFPPALE